MSARYKVEKVKVHYIFNEFDVFETDDGEFFLENHPYIFNSKIDAVTWLRAFNSAEQDLLIAQNRIADLKNHKWIKRAN